MNPIKCSSYVYVAILAGLILPGCHKGDSKQVSENGEVTQTKAVIANQESVKVEFQKMPEDMRDVAAKRLDKVYPYYNGSHYLKNSFGVLEIKQTLTEVKKSELTQADTLNGVTERYTVTRSPVLPGVMRYFLSSDVKWSKWADIKIEQIGDYTLSLYVERSKGNVKIRKGYQDWEDMVESDTSNLPK